MIEFELELEDGSVFEFVPEPTGAEAACLTCGGSQLLVGAIAHRDYGVAPTVQCVVCRSWCLSSIPRKAHRHGLLLTRLRDGVSVEERD